MNTEKAAVAEIKARGQLTIPKKIREMRHLEEGQIVTIIPVGDALIVAPKRLKLDEARREIRKVLKAANMTVEELVKPSKRIERAISRDHGKKIRLRFSRFKCHPVGFAFRQGAPRLILDVLSLRLPVLQGRRKVQYTGD